MQDFGTKADNSAPPGGQLSAAEFNNLATENENAVLRSGQALSGASAVQLATSLFLHGSKSTTFQDSGAANAYVATPVSGASGVLIPIDYSAMNGAMIAFKASAANTTASTLNIGQTTGTLLGTKAIVDQAGAALTANLITAGAYIQLRYDSSIGAGSWVLLPWASFVQPSNVVKITASGTYTRPAGLKGAFVQVQAAGGGGGGTTGAGTGAAAASGGSAGGYSEGYFTAATIGASQTVTIGSGGSGGTSGSVAGTAGTASSFGALLTATGGSFGGSTGNSTQIVRGAPPDGAGGGTGATQNGQNGQVGTIFGTTALAIAGSGGSSRLGVGGAGRNEASNGFAGHGFGSGGAGAASSTVNQTGGAGAPGLIIVTEYY